MISYDDEGREFDLFYKFYGFLALAYDEEVLQKEKGFFAFGFTLATYPEHQRKGVSNRSGATWQSTFRPVRHSQGEVLIREEKEKTPDEMVRGVVVVVVVVLTTITR